MDAGEEVEFSSLCVNETAALNKYTLKIIDYYKNTHP